MKLDAPTGFTFPPKGFAVEDKGFIAPSEENANVEVVIALDSNRLQKLAPFAPWDGKDGNGYGKVEKQGKK